MFDRLKKIFSSEIKQQASNETQELLQEVEDKELPRRLFVGLIPTVAMGYLVGQKAEAGTWKKISTTGSTVINEKSAALAGTAIDVSSAAVFSKTITGATTFTVANVPASGTVASFILDLTNGGAFAITWWAGVKWAGGTAPTLTAAGRDSLGFFTYDGGATWSGLVLGKDIK